MALDRVASKTSDASAPPADSPLVDIRFRHLVPDEAWAALPAPVRRRFSKRLENGRTAIYVGEILEMQMSAAGWLLAQAGRLIGGPLPTRTDTHVPSVVAVTEDMATGGQNWTRWSVLAALAALGVTLFGLRDLAASRRSQLLANGPAGDLVRVLLRIGLVLGTQGGMLARLLTPFEFALGGPIGSGRQWMSWIDRDDLIRLIAHAIATPELDGAVNATAPTPARNQEFAAALGQALSRPAALRMPAWLLKRLVGDFADELLLGGQRVLPKKAEATGFTYRYPTLQTALAAMLGEAAGRDPASAGAAAAHGRPG